MLKFAQSEIRAELGCANFRKKEDSNEIRKQMEKGVPPHEIKVDVRISVLKPLHAAWITKFYDKMQIESEIILNGWRRSGILDAVNQPISKEDPFALKNLLLVIVTCVKKVF